MKNLKWKAAEFSFVSNGRQGETFSFITYASSCVDGKGILGQVGIQNDAPVLEITYKWSANGSAMYDAAGKALCDLLQGRFTK